MRARLVSALAFAALIAGATPARAAITTPPNGATVRGNFIPVTESMGGQDTCSFGGGADTVIVISNAGGGQVLAQSKGAPGPLTVYWNTLGAVPNGNYTIRSYGYDVYNQGFLSCGGSYHQIGQSSVMVDNRSFIAYLGATSGVAGEPVMVSARITTEGGTALASRPVSFCFAGGACASATTDGNGATSTTLAAPELAGPATLIVSVTANAYFGAASITQPIAVAARSASIRIDGELEGARGHQATLSAMLTDATAGSPQNGQPLAGRIVHFSLGSATVDATTDDSGRAAAQITLDQEPGTYPLTARFDGDRMFGVAQETADFVVRWEHTFVDETGAGTVFLNPTTSEFRVMIGGDLSPIVKDPSMRALDADRIAVAYRDDTVTLIGVFELSSKRFAALARGSMLPAVLRRTL